jgi:hypothetical protein
MPSFITNLFKSSTVSTSSLSNLVPHGSLSMDITVLFVLFLFFLFYGLYLGKSRIVSLIVAFYPALLVYARFPFIKQLTFLTSQKGIVVNELFIFVAILILLDIIIGRYIFSETLGGSVHFLKIAGFSLGVVTLVLILSYTTIHLDVFYNFSNQIDLLFSTPNRILIGLAIPFILLFIF